jgi:hypothetical protein
MQQMGLFDIASEPLSEMPLLIKYDPIAAGCFFYREPVTVNRKQLPFLV